MLQSVGSGFCENVVLTYPTQQNFTLQPKAANENCNMQLEQVGSMWLTTINNQNFTIFTSTPDPFSPGNFGDVITYTIPIYNKSNPTGSAIGIIGI